MLRGFMIDASNPKCFVLNMFRHATKIPAHLVDECDFFFTQQRELRFQLNSADSSVVRYFCRSQESLNNLSCRHSVTTQESR